MGYIYVQEYLYRITYQICSLTSLFPLFLLHCSTAGLEQSKEIVFAPSSEPAFVSIPQNRFVEPFVLNNGTWTIIIEAEGILLVSLAHMQQVGNACGGPT